MNSIINFKNIMYYSYNIVFIFALTTNATLADSVDKSILVKQNGEVENITGAFTESDTHPFGFDDYTNWSLNAMDYYGSIKMGKCILPYISISRGIFGNTNFILNPPSIQNPVNLHSNPITLVYSPFSTRTSCNVLFFMMYNFLDTQNLVAKKEERKLSEIQVKNYRAKYVSVGIRLVHEDRYLSTDIDFQNAVSTINKVYKQACIEISVFQLAPKTVRFDLDNNGKLDVSDWTTAEMDTIIQAADDNNYDKMLFVVSNPSDNSNGFMMYNQRYGFIHFNSGQTIAHELGHGFGLYHTYEIPNKGHDDLNLMDPVWRADRLKLRFNQWNIVNP